MSVSKVTSYDPITIWDIHMGDRYVRSDINEISIGMTIWDMGDDSIDMVILDIDMGYHVTLRVSHAGVEEVADARLAATAKVRYHPVFCSNERLVPGL
jgi:hypothetical protein